ncbi:MAG TPA: hypothetical protein VH276_15505 [Solirubrobacteraceae bacterium]|nr:hypothetical protein [Solirubrobacteraceae bacterium]
MHVAEAGTYVLKLQVVISGACASTILSIDNPGLSVVQLGA